MTTLKEIARQCSVSIATVSNILNNKSNVSEETKQRVLQVIKGTGYKPNYMARGLRAAKSQTIGLLIDDLTDFSSPTIIDGIISYLERKNYKTVLEDIRFYSKWDRRDSQNKEYAESVKQAIQQFDAIKVDGIIYISSHCRSIDIIPENIPIPITICYAFSDKPELPSVMLNDELAACQLTSYLLKNGHKKIAAILGIIDNYHTDKRIEGFQRAFLEAGLQADQHLFYYGDWTFNSGYTLCKNILETRKDCTAIFCFNDLMAAGAYKAIREVNLTPGKDISVVGFDSRFPEEIMEPALTTMKLPLFEIGRSAAETNLQQIDNMEIKNKKIYIDCTFIEGKSVCKI